MSSTLAAAVCLAWLCLTAALPAPYGAAQRPLRFDADGSFQISIFEDLHFGENAWDQWGPQQDVNSVAVMNKVLEAESQQLVVLNGDLFTGENAFLENSTVYVDKIVAPLLARDLTWASTYGNHDSAYNLSRHGILARERLECPNPASCAPALLLWFFDSRGGFYYQRLDATGARVGQPDWVDVSVVDWFSTTSASLTRAHGRTIPSLAFVHIPTNASQAFQLGRGVDPNRQPGVNDDDGLAQQAQGWCPDGTNDGSCEYGGQDVPFMQAITSTPGLMAVFSGHDHGDTWCYRWNTVLPGMTVHGNGVNLCFGQHSGYGGYGTWTRGSRQVRLTEDTLSDFVAETWIRLETGDIVGHVTLNSTYGQDVYPATPDTHTECPTCDY